jgi:hypothetical protein
MPNLPRLPWTMVSHCTWGVLLTLKLSPSRASSAVRGTQLPLRVLSGRWHANDSFKPGWFEYRNTRLEGPDGPNSPGEVFVVAMLAAKIGEIDVSRHIRGLLRRRPVGEVVGNATVSKITGSGGLQVAIH